MISQRLQASPLRKNCLSIVAVTVAFFSLFLCTPNAVLADSEWDSLEAAYQDWMVTTLASKEGAEFNRNLAETTGSVASSAMTSWLAWTTEDPSREQAMNAYDAGVDFGVMAVTFFDYAESQLALSQEHYEMALIFRNWAENCETFRPVRLKSGCMVESQGKFRLGEPFSSAIVQDDAG